MASFISPVTDDFELHEMEKLPLYRKEKNNRDSNNLIPYFLNIVKYYIYNTIKYIYNNMISKQINPDKKSFNPPTKSDFFILAHPDAKIPTRGTNGPEGASAGYDFYAVEDAFVHGGEQVLVETGIKTKFDKDTVLFLKSRSGLVFKNKIDTVAGVIDSDYKDSIKVILSNRNHTGDLFNIKKGDRISQGVFRYKKLIKTNTPNSISFISNKQNN